jgi:hypothetical protein
VIATRELERSDFYRESAGAPEAGRRVRFRLVYWIFFRAGSLPDALLIIRRLRCWLGSFKRPHAHDRAHRRRRLGLAFSTNRGSANF